MYDLRDGKSAQLFSLIRKVADCNSSVVIELSSIPLCEINIRSVKCCRLPRRA
jgi:hypothetical protein